MSIPGLNPARCAHRNALMSLRGKEAAPVRLFGSAERFFARETPGGILIDEAGDLPTTREESLARIRAMQPPGAEPLKDEEVFLHFCESANSNFVTDRFMFLGSTTLLNIAKAGEAGVAFMNMHRSGDFSTPGELPYGRTFAGRYEQYLLEDGQIFERAIQGVYMLSGMKPAGDQGPDSDTIHRLIQAGIVSDVSVGISRGAAGWRRCDVCQNNYDRSSECGHYAGSLYNVTPEDQERQKARGVLGGQATYTLEDWEQSEVSAVYDGAVPGAGFAKAHDALEAGTVPEPYAAQLHALLAAHIEALGRR